MTAKPYSRRPAPVSRTRNPSPWSRARGTIEAGTLTPRGGAVTLQPQSASFRADGGRFGVLLSHGFTGS
ncbi:hypothetical protein BH24ACT12_BH24ACT12_26980 [soil metagenome]